MAIVYLDGKPGLHLVDEAIRFTATRFLPKMTTEGFWDAIFISWSYIYTGLPNTMVVDKGSQFGKVFAVLATVHGVHVEKTGVESYNSLIIAERYHKPLRDTYSYSSI